MTAFCATCNSSVVKDYSYAPHSPKLLLVLFLLVAVLFVAMDPAFAQDIDFSKANKVDNPFSTWMTTAMDTLVLPKKGERELKSILVFVTLVFACKFALIAIPFIASSITGKLNLATIAAARLAPLNAGGVALAKPATMLANKMELVRSGWENNGMTTQQVKASERMRTKSYKNYADIVRKMHEKFDRIKANQKLKIKKPPKN